MRCGLPDTDRSAPRTEHAGTVRASWSGALALLSDPTVRRLLLAQWLPPAFAAGAEALLVAYSAQREIPTGTGAVLMGALAASMLLRNFVVGRFLRPTLRERYASLFLIVLGAPLIAPSPDRRYRRPWPCRA